MLKKDPNFRRLKIGGAGLAGVSSLWLGPDHLLVVEIAGITEKYRRFYFRDIQAVIVEPRDGRVHRRFARDTDVGDMGVVLDGSSHGGRVCGVNGLLCRATADQR